MYLRDSLYSLQARRCTSRLNNLCTPMLQRRCLCPLDIADIRRYLSRPYSHQTYLLGKRYTLTQSLMPAGPYSLGNDLKDSSCRKGHS